MTSRFFIQATGQRRQAIWQRIFNTDVLPVLSRRPRMDADALTLRPVAVYELALRQLSDNQLRSLAGHMARRTKRPYADILNELVLRPSFPVRAGDDVKLIEPEAEPPPPVFVCAQTLRPAFAGLF